jgi:hypothetical protein
MQVVVISSLPFRLHTGRRGHRQLPLPMTVLVSAYLTGFTGTGTTLRCLS